MQRKTHQGSSECGTQVCGALVVAVATAFGAAGPVSAAPLLLPVGQPDLPYYGATARDVSADGSVAIGSDSLGGFRWTPTAGTERVAYVGAAVSGNGELMVGTGGTPIFSLPSMGFSYRFATGAFAQWYPGDRTSWSVASAVNTDGSVIVGTDYYPAYFLPPPPVAGTYATRRSSLGVQYLGDLPGGAIFSSGLGVSADGSVVVGFGTTAVGREAFRYTDALGLVALGDLPGGTTESVANAVSRFGQFTVGYGNSSNGQEAFRHTVAGGMVGLGDLPGGDFSSEAKDVSDDGKVVVGNGTSASGAEAFYWNETDGIARLWDVLLANGVNPALGGWSSLNAANGVSADGLTVVGFGTLTNGNQQAFIANIPEPTAAGLLSVAGTVLLRRRRQAQVR